MKIAPIIRALHVRRRQGSLLNFRLAHTGQHYDARMSGDLFAELGVPNPDVKLRGWKGDSGRAGGGDHDPV
jgi:UDP-N-acetylglucosamine 2-epimerase (non-hydrolysing)